MIQVFCDQCKREIKKEELIVRIEIKPRSRDYRIPVPEWEKEAQKNGEFCSAQCAVQWLSSSPWALFAD
jgi:hypothetical protein